MATTIQVVENLRIGKFVKIDGKSCEVESISFSQALTEKAALEALIEAMAEELKEQDVIGIGQNGQYYWRATGEPLVPDEDFED